MLVAASLRGRATVLAGAEVPAVPAGAAVGLGLLAAAGCLLGAAALGRLAAAVAPRLLGPSARDRLEVALARLEAEAEHARLARELHDGIGHALTIIGLQAAAGRRTLDRAPDRSGVALGRIEQAARQALTELDAMLALLRTGEVDRGPAPDLTQLPALVETYRSAGMELSTEMDRGWSAPRLVSTTAYRIVAEGLTNASRYAGAGPVDLRVRHAPGQLTVVVESPLATPGPPGPPVRRPGRGLVGVTERVALFGGRVEAGPVERRWVLRAEIPTGTARA